MKELSEGLLRSLRRTYGAASSLSNSPGTVSKASEMVRSAGNLSSLRAALDESPNGRSA